MTDEPLGSHVLELQVTDVVEETDDARSLVFAVPDGAQIPADRLRYSPGQFLTLRVPSDRTGSVARCYSLCSSPFTGDPMTVTVKRTADGYASNWLCDHAHAGMKIHVLAPSGTFVPKTLDQDFLLLAAGSGITPMMAICKSALAEGSGKVVLIYANRDENSVIFGGALRELSAKYPDRLTVLHWLETVQGLPSAAALAGLAAPYIGRDAYICGPGPFMAAAEEALKDSGAPTDKIHIEVFKSLESDPFARVVIAEDDSDEGPATAIVTQLVNALVAAGGNATRCAGRATRSCWTCCSTKASTRRSRAARATAAHARCSRRAARSRWRSTMCSSNRIWTRG